MSKQIGNQPEKSTVTRKRFNPHKNVVRDLVALHTMSVGMGAIQPEGTVEKEIVLANGSKFSVTVKRIESATSATDPWGFTREKKARVKKSA